MAFCSLCARIVKIRLKQGKDFYDDLCEECKLEYLSRSENRSDKGKEKVSVL